MAVFLTPSNKTNFLNHSALASSKSTNGVGTKRRRSRLSRRQRSMCVQMNLVGIARLGLRVNKPSRMRKHKKWTGSAHWLALMWLRRQSSLLLSLVQLPLKDSQRRSRNQSWNHLPSDLPQLHSSHTAHRATSLSVEFLPPIYSPSRLACLSQKVN